MYTGYTNVQGYIVHNFVHTTVAQWFSKENSILFSSGKLG